MLYDAVLLASDELMKKQHGRKALIILSDGVDTGSKTSLTSAIASAQRADTLVYSILFADEEGYGRGRGFRRRRPWHGPARWLSGRTVSTKPARRQENPAADFKGNWRRIFRGLKKQPIEQIYSRIQEELRNQYSLGYTSDKADAGFRKITLAVKQKGLVVQARDGYYAGR